MEEETDTLSNLCADLVSLTRLGPALKHLFRTKPAGEWAAVAELYRAAGITDLGIKPELAAAWLPSRSAAPDYAVILFCDEDLNWSTTAFYSVGWLFREDDPQLTPAALPRPVR